jgi:hypothetical protein
MEWYTLSEDEGSTQDYSSTSVERSLEHRVPTQLCSIVACLIIIATSFLVVQLRALGTALPIDIEIEIPISPVTTEDPLYAFLLEMYLEIAITSIIVVVTYYIRSVSVGLTQIHSKLAQLEGANRKLRAEVAAAARRSAATAASLTELTNGGKKGGFQGKGKDREVTYKGRTSSYRPRTPSREPETPRKSSVRAPQSGRSKRR